MCLCIWGYVYSRQITECKDRVVSLMEIYKEVDERLFDKMVNDNYWVDEYVEFLKKLRQQKIQEIVDRVKIVDDSLVADGDYFYYTGQIGQERLNPTQQLWLTLWLRDMIKN